ncbi:hypothetical protein [Mangrovivirga cuniculi]|uniref:Uncharacterized protein n=1 Tax=Mangrovivirga cuniculi TaxID=2715131 RepID=A0A4D7K2H3_9BACT|nr:hypothetical protein [Mangrovivirga cuniculi]QCK15084.1 hypothetical protein DCC35_10155 [Mangrovivirga cuniculi]
MDADFNEFISNLMQKEGVVYDPEELALNYFGKEEIYSLINSLKHSREVNTLEYLEEKTGIDQNEKRYFISYQNEKEIKNTRIDQVLG